MAGRDKATDQLKSYASSNPPSDKLTSSNGAPLDSLTTSMTAGPRGPIVLQVRGWCASVSYEAQTAPVFWSVHGPHTWQVTD
jgi:hypothetical protein